MNGWVAARSLSGTLDGVDASGRPVAEQEVDRATPHATPTGDRRIARLPDAVPGTFDVGATARARPVAATGLIVRTDDLGTPAGAARFTAVSPQRGGYDIAARLAEERRLGSVERPVSCRLGPSVEAWITLGANGAPAGSHTRRAGRSPAAGAGASERKTGATDPLRGPAGPRSPPGARRVCRSP